MVQGEETIKEAQGRARRVFALLQKEYPEIRCTLDYGSPFQLMVMTILAAQCTDARVNIVAGPLFEQYPDPAAFCRAKLKDVEVAIHSTGFFRQKAKNIIATSKILIEKHKGEVPTTLEELTELPGVGRKTANVLLGECFNTPGVIVDTHCGRLARRLGFTQAEEPRQVERDLMGVWPKKHWTGFSHMLVFHGRAVCASRSPKCELCSLRRHCPRTGLPQGTPK